MADHAGGHVGEVAQVAVLDKNAFAVAIVYQVRLHVRRGGDAG